MAAPVKLLAFDTSTELLSVALQPGAGQPMLEHAGAGGAQASASLIPAIEHLLARAGVGLRELDAIAFGRGPGSFTGLRTACAVAQGLAFGAARPVLPIDTLLAVAEDARGRCGADEVVAVLDARMGEVYWAAYRREASGAWTTVTPPRLGRPEAVEIPPGWAVAGNALALLPPGTEPRIEALPTASALLRLAPVALDLHHGGSARDALPLYIRDKVAQTTEERAAERALKEMNRGSRPGVV